MIVVFGRNFMVVASGIKLIITDRFRKKFYGSSFRYKIYYSRYRKKFYGSHFRYKMYDN